MPHIAPKPTRTEPDGRRSAPDGSHALLLSVRFPARADAVRTARHLLARTLRLHAAEPDAIETAVLLTSEVVTNGVVHGTEDRVFGHLDLRASRAGSQLAIEVHDPSPTPPRRPDSADLLDESGRGLLLVSELADAHGTHPVEGGGKAVWFTMAAWPPPDRRSR